jgi:hypothetical protein
MWRWRTIRRRRCGVGTVFIKKFSVAVFLTGFSTLVFLSCSTPLLEKAFKPDMDSKESIEIIGEYCVSCHVHKDFEPAAHVKKTPALYKESQYSDTEECRACHSYSKTWLLDVRRGTHWPPEK